MTATTPPQISPREAVASRRLDARRRRVRAIRRRMAALTAGTFLAVSGAILVQLVTGHDPALAHGATVSRTSATSGSATSGVASGSPRSSASAAAATPSAVTTSAS